MTLLWPLFAAPFVGSFLGVLIQRLPASRPVALARSECDECGAPLVILDLIPLLSFALLRGRCRHCSARISPFHWWVELVAVVVPASALSAGLGGPALWCSCAAGWTLLALAWIEGGTMTLPDVLTLPLIFAGLCATWWFKPQSLADHVIAAVFGYAALRTVARTQRWPQLEGMGANAKLLAGLGAWIGFADLPILVLGAVLARIVWSALLWLRGIDLEVGNPLRFGPFFALAGWVVLLLQA